MTPLTTLSTPKFHQNKNIYDENQTPNTPIHTQYPTAPHTPNRIQASLPHEPEADIYSFRVSLRSSKAKKISVPSITLLPLNNSHFKAKNIFSECLVSQVSNLLNQNIEFKLIRFGAVFYDKADLELIVKSKYTFDISLKVEIIFLNFLLENNITKNFPLIFYNAAVKNKLKIIKLISPHIPTSQPIYKNKPILYILNVSRKSNYLEIKKIVLKNLSDKSEWVIQQKQLLKTTKGLAKVFECKGRFSYQGLSYNMEGSFAYDSARLIYKTLVDFWIYLPQIMPQEIIELLAQSYDECLHFNDPDKIKNAFNRIQEDKPTLLVSGFKSHIVGICFWKGIVIYCNRGAEGDSNRPLMIGNYNKEKITQCFLKYLIKMTKNTDLEFKEAFNMGAESLFFDHIHFSENRSLNVLEVACQPSLQNVGNCSYANMEGLLKPLILLALLEPKNFVLDENDQAMTTATTFYHNFDAYIKTRILETYIQKNVFPQPGKEAYPTILFKENSILKKCFVIFKRLRENLNPCIDPKLLPTMDNILSYENFYTTDN